ARRRALGKAGGAGEILTAPAAEAEPVADRAADEVDGEFPRKVGQAHQAPLRPTVHSSTTRSSTSSGSEPPSRTTSWKALMSKRAPRASLALVRRRSISVWPIL